MSNILCGRPDFDTATHWGQYYLEQYVKNVAVALGFSVEDLYDTLTTRAKYIAGMDAGAVYLSANGHGNATTFTGHNQADVFLVDDSETARIADGKHFNFLSCSMGQDLAPYLCDSGAVGVHAYTNVYTFWYDSDNYPNSYATPFFLSHTVIDAQLLAGATHGAAHTACLAKYDEYLADPTVPEVVKGDLLDDRNGKMFCGDSGAVLSLSFGTVYQETEAKTHDTGVITRIREHQL